MSKTEQTSDNPQTGNSSLGVVSGSLSTYDALMYNCIGMKSTWIKIKGEHKEDAIDNFYRTHPTCELFEVEDCH